MQIVDISFFSKFTMFLFVIEIEFYKLTKYVKYVIMSKDCLTCVLTFLGSWSLRLAKKALKNIIVDF